jgi:4-amino-4-deoxy-L-arabinose transferase-like glycosyltransferase
MTSYALAARVVTVVMSLVVIYSIGKIVEDLAGRRAGLLAAATCALNAVFVYYSCTSNLDVPYVFWGVLSLRALVRAQLDDEPRKLRRCALYAALSIATKDQAYALFGLGIPLALALWLACAPRARRSSPLFKEALVSLAIGAAVLLVADGALTNPTGFRARLAFLAGPASQPFAHYTADAYGRFLVCLDSVLHFPIFYPLVLAPLVLLGVARCARLSGVRRSAALAPLAFLVSFTLLFNAVARRDEPRFLLPQMVLWATYAGVGLDWILARRTHLAAVVARAVAGGVFAAALFGAASVHASMLLDPRYDAERWLAAHVGKGDHVEIHGNNVYLLRIPRWARVVRVGMEPVETRSPLPGVEEKVDAFSRVNVRAPKWIVVFDGYAGHFLWVPPPQAASGRVIPETQARSSSDEDATGFFRSLADGRLGYRLAYESTWKSDVFPRVDYHGTLGQPCRVYQLDE